MGGILACAHLVHLTLARSDAELDRLSGPRGPDRGLADPAFAARCANRHVGKTQHANRRAGHVRSRCSGHAAAPRRRVDRGAAAGQSSRNAAAMVAHEARMAAALHDAALEAGMDAGTGLEAVVVAADTEAGSGLAVGTRHLVAAYRRGERRGVHGTSPSDTRDGARDPPSVGRLSGAFR